MRRNKGRAVGSRGPEGPGAQGAGGGEGGDGQHLGHVAPRDGAGHSGLRECQDAGCPRSEKCLSNGADVG